MPIGWIGDDSLWSRASQFNDKPAGGGDGTAKQSTPKMPRQRYCPWETGPVEIRRQTCRESVILEWGCLEVSCLGWQTLPPAGSSLNWPKAVLEESRFSGEKFLHHALFDQLGFVPLLFEGRDLRVHVAEDFGDRLLVGSAMTVCGLGTSEFNDKPASGGDGTADQSTPKMPRQRYCPWETGPVEIRC